MKPGRIFMFSGQGSHYPRMAEALFEGNAIFRDWMLELDRIAVRETAQSIVAALYPRQPTPASVFDRTLLTHPAIFMVEYSLARSLIEAGVEPDGVLGVSMGSFAAAAVAGCLDASDAMHLLIEQARSLERSCEAGTMIAVLGERALFDQEFLARHSELAAVNSESHFVISAPAAAAAAIESELQRRQIMRQRLPVRFAYHSKWIDPAREQFVTVARSLTPRAPRTPLICCDRAMELPRLEADFFWNVVRRPMRFRDAVARLEEKGPQHYIDVGPGGTLATVLKYILPPGSRSRPQPIVTPFGRETHSLAAVMDSRLTP